MNRQETIAKVLEEMLSAARNYQAVYSPEAQARLAAAVAKAERLLYVPGERLNNLEDLWAKADAGPKPELVMPLEGMDPFKEESLQWLDGGARVAEQLLAILELGNREVEGGLVEPATAVFAQIRAKATVGSLAEPDHGAKLLEGSKAEVKAVREERAVRRKTQGAPSLEDLKEGIREHMRLKHPGPLPEPIKLEGEGPTASELVLEDRQERPVDCPQNGPTQPQRNNLDG